jgi:RNA polymerase sigma-70 factor (ECF subfamily)
MSEKEYKDIIERYSDEVYRYLAKNLQDIDKAKDIVQDSFLALWNNRDKVEKDKVKYWLFTTTHNNLLKQIRYDKVRKNQIQNETSTSLNSDNKQLLDYLLNQLNDKMRQCLMLKEWQGFSVKEIAEIMQISESDVKVNIFRAKLKLKEIYENNER